MDLSIQDGVKRAEFGVISEKVKQAGGYCVIRKLGESILKHRIVAELH